jgi:hypothetical protein
LLAKHIIGYFKGFFPDNKIISRTSKIRGTLVFLCPCERERERERKGKRERERTKMRVT